MAFVVDDRFIVTSTVRHFSKSGRGGARAMRCVQPVNSPCRAPAKA
jgi:hypothetical protein